MALVRWFVVCILGVFFLQACAHASQRAQGDKTLQVWTPNAFTEVRIAPPNVTGPDVQLSLTDRGLRGRAFGRTVDLSFQPGRIVGLVGGMPTQLAVKPGAEAMEIHGLYAGQLSRFQWSTAFIEGNVGPCGYDLRGEQGEQKGFRQCIGSQILQTAATVRVPSELMAHSDEAKVAMLSVMLATPAN